MAKRNEFTEGKKSNNFPNFGTATAEKLLVAKSESFEFGVWFWLQIFEWLIRRHFIIAPSRGGNIYELARYSQIKTFENIAGGMHSLWGSKFKVCIWNVV